MEHVANERDKFLDPDATRCDPDANDNTPVMTRFAPELSGIGSKVTFDWLYSWLADPAHFAPDTKMPNMPITGYEKLKCIGCHSGKKTRDMVITTISTSK